MCAQMLCRAKEIAQEQKREKQKQKNRTGEQHDDLTGDYGWIEKNEIARFFSVDSGKIRNG